MKLKIVLGLLICLGSQAFGMNRVTVPAKRLALSSFAVRTLAASAKDRWPLLKHDSVEDVVKIERTLHEAGNSLKNATVLELFEEGGPYTDSAAVIWKLKKQIMEAESKLSEARSILYNVERNHNDEPLEGRDYYWYHSFGAAPYMVWIDKKN